jgi:hypothetical protein
MSQAMFMELRQALSEAGISRINEDYHPPRFVSAFSLLGLQSGIQLVDGLVGGLKPSTIALITGTQIRLQAAERYCVRAGMPERLGGLAGKTFFIDGGNSFDIYLFTSIAREHGLNLEEVLDNLIISRAFTPYELQQLICKDSKGVFEAHHPKLVVISDVFELFNEDVEVYEARRIIGRIADAVKRISKREQVPVVMTSGPAEQLRDLGECSTVAVEIIEGEPWSKSRVLKHPTKKPMEVLTENSGKHYNQKLLVPPAVVRHG